MSLYVLDFQGIDKSKLTLAGGKGANLGEIFKIEGIQVPVGLCISTDAYKSIVRESSSINKLLDRLSMLRMEDRNEINAQSSEIRRLIEEIAVPEALQEELNLHLSRIGGDDAYAVRSSATAEDSPTASFAGQQDTYLNVRGKAAILQHVSKCWASLYTERAIVYRIQNGLDHRSIAMAVLLQKMIFPQAAGILFTADPVTSNRKVSTIDASFGLGEALVSGLVNADVYKVRGGNIVAKKISSKTMALFAAHDGGTIAQEVDPEWQNRSTLTDEQILQLEQLGRKIEAHLGSPQDIEWCLADDSFHILQSRPITTLFPIPDANDQENHVYVSVGHQQMMTDAMKPLGLSFFQLTAGRSMYQAAGRLFVDVAQELASPARRDIILSVFGKSDPLIEDALSTILERGDFIRLLPDDTRASNSGNGSQVISPTVFQILNDYDPQIVLDLIDSSKSSIKKLREDLQTKSGPALFDLILEDMQRRKRSSSESQSLGVILTAMNAASWLNEKVMEWLGEKNAADTLSQSGPNNITSEMGLALLDVADVIRRHPVIIKYLQQAKDNKFLDELDLLAGGPECRGAIEAFLERYGVRCAGEIDITRHRWLEKPTALIAMLLCNVKNCEPNESHRRFEKGREEALRKEQALLGKMKHLPNGEEKAEKAERMIRLVRNLSGYREYPKFDIVSRYFIYKQAMLREAEGLVQSGVVREKEDIYFLTFQELHDVVRTEQLDNQLISKRKDEHKFYGKLTPPRVITSDGEIVAAHYKRENLPADAIVGLAISSGVVEGRARVVLNLEDAVLEDGDILVTSFTDPSWTPLFVSIKGLVTEVGGLMTHGAVIAREYGLPAIVGVENATKLIPNGRRLRLDGTEGHLELL